MVSKVWISFAESVSEISSDEIILVSYFAESFLVALFVVLSKTILFDWAESVLNSLSNSEKSDKKKSESLNNNWLLSISNSLNPNPSWDIFFIVVLIKSFFSSSLVKKQLKSLKLYSVIKL